jgi:hypothetical protein
MNRIARTATLAAAIAALGAPGALAQTVSPDAQDAAAGRGTFNSPDVTVLKVEADPAPQDSGVDWTDVAIGAGGALGVLAIGAGGAALLTRRPRRGAAAVH